MLTEIQDWVPPLLGALAALADAILGVGIIVPGEVAVTGLASTVDGAQTGPFVALVALGASLGDHINFALGRASGARLAGSRIVTVLGARHWHRGVRLLDRYGPTAIVLTRPIPGVRTFVPAIAGASGLSYVRFLAASLMGSMLWAMTWALAGNVVTLVRSDPGLLVACAAVALVTLVRVRMRTAPPADGNVQPTPSDAEDQPPR